MKRLAHVCKGRGRPEAGVPLTAMDIEPLGFDAGRLYLYTDGSCYYKDRCGGWGYVIVRVNRHEKEPHIREAYGFSFDVTNNAMELRAILEGLRYILRNYLSRTPITVVSDSQYSLSVLTTLGDKWEALGWKNPTGRNIQNKRIIRATRKVISKLDRPTSFEWVRGHTGHPLNERADDLAGYGRKISLGMRKRHAKT